MIRLFVRAPVAAVLFVACALLGGAGCGSCADGSGLPSSPDPPAKPPTTLSAPKMVRAPLIRTITLQDGAAPSAPAPAPSASP